MKNFRCDCPITSAIDIIGDKWILVLVKQMLFEEKQTFKDFTESNEAIATNILTTKLKLLIELEILKKSKLPHNKKSIYYHLTDRGLSLTSIIVELAIWSGENIRDLNTNMTGSDELDAIKANKDEFIKSIIANYKENISKTMFIES
ncbi:MAG: winged helix-turn-helix transcriptional regulator [Polaribacter sp.]|nr:winged helix-turn-helix transcriptional regulator [Polaribacter sp.]